MVLYEFLWGALWSLLLFSDVVLSGRAGCSVLVTVLMTRNDVGCWLVLGSVLALVGEAAKWCVKSYICSMSYA